MIMDVSITGTGWVTPLGADVDLVWEAILAGKRTPGREIAGPAGRKAHLAACIPPGLVDGVARNSRLRRASNISLYAAAAVLAALRSAGLDPAQPGKIALIFAVSDGGVIYTRKFYDQVVREGAGSPLLFPETVYNAPGSHVAALLGLDGITYTLVGDASVGLAALGLGAELVNSGRVDRCIVAGAEEVDWVLCEAYRKWRFLTAGEMEIGSNRGTLLAEGAAAIVLGREGNCRIQSVSDGVPFFRRAEAAGTLAEALAQLPREVVRPRVISCANGTFVDRAERAAVEAAYGSVPAVYPKVALGDAFASSALMQMICAVESLRREPGTVLVPVIGLNQQAAAALISG